jgi:hypothetical protein
MKGREKGEKKKKRYEKEDRLGNYEEKGKASS